MTHRIKGSVLFEPGLNEYLSSATRSTTPHKTTRSRKKAQCINLSTCPRS
jgi:hypothetical protein